MAIGTLLYVEDDMDLRDYVAAEMEDFCDEVLTANNGQHALAVLAENHVDVVLTDVMMPVMDGLELCRSIKSNPELKHIPVIMLTARADTNSIKQGYEALADFYMDKPFEIDQLISVLQEKLHV